MKNDLKYNKKKMNQFKPKSYNEITLGKIINGNTTVSGIQIQLKPLKESYIDSLPNYKKKPLYQIPIKLNYNHNHNHSYTLSKNQSLPNCKRRDLLNNAIDNDLNTPRIQSYKEQHNPLINSSIIKFHEEALELQLIKSRMENEICILNEKNKSLNKLLSMSKIENDLLQGKYNDLLSDYKTETKRLKETNQLYKTTYDKSTNTIRSFLGIVIEVIEIFLCRNSTQSNMNNTVNKTSFSNPNNNQGEYSIDVYDSFNGDEEKRLSIIDQIQGILLSKVTRISKVFGMNIDKDIERIQSWNNNVSLSFRKLSRINDDLSKIMNSNSNSTSNDFDLSVSGQFYNLSPKFNSIENQKKENNKSPKPIITESILNELKNCSFGDYNSNGKSEENKSSSITIKNSLKGLDCSFGQEIKIESQKDADNILAKASSVKSIHNNNEEGKHVNSNINNVPDAINITIEDLINE